jgi:hypothetical protein
MKAVNWDGKDSSTEGRPVSHSKHRQLSNRPVLGLCPLDWSCLEMTQLEQ